MPLPVLRRLVFTLVVMTTGCQGSKIVFTVTPPEIIGGVSPTFTARCSLEDEDGNKNVVGVTSIVISKTEDLALRDVATITSGQPPVLVSLEPDANVTGDISKQPGYLQVNWSAPTSEQAGNYNCEIRGNDEGGITSTFKSSLFAAYDKSAITISELAKLISQWKDEVEALKKTVGDLTHSTTSLSPPHSEGGVVSFEDSDTWGEPFKHRRISKEVNFSVPYAKVPLVTLAVTALDVDQRENIRLKLEVSDLTTSGFKIFCETWWSTKIHFVWVQWASSLQ